jgi:hypothetical protein
MSTRAFLMGHYQGYTKALARPYYTETTLPRALMLGLIGISAATAVLIIVDLAMVYGRRLSVTPLPATAQTDIGIRTSNSPVREVLKTTVVQPGAQDLFPPALPTGPEGLVNTRPLIWYTAATCEGARD